MYYLYLGLEAGRELIGTAPDLISAQFFAAKYSQARRAAVGVYGAATGYSRQPLYIFNRGVKLMAEQYVQS